MKVMKDFVDALSDGLGDEGLWVRTKLQSPGWGMRECRPSEATRNREDFDDGGWKGGEMTEMKMKGLESH
jgi:hypothetical protein